MSFDYFVAIRASQWPTSRAVQAALERLGYPVTLAVLSNQNFVTEESTLGVTLEGRPVVLEAAIEQATDVDDPESLFGYISSCAEPNFQISNGDFFLTLTFRADVDQIRAGLFVAAALILSFDGYGFENQTETHGGIDFANQLAAEAADANAFG